MTKLPVSQWPLLDQNPDLQVAVRISLAAGASLREGYAGVKVATQKDDASDVSQFDRPVEELARRMLRQHDSAAEILGEELGGETAQWVIDSLDGTTNFVRSIPMCSFTIAKLASSQPGAPSELGVVYDFLAEEMYYAVRGRGAYLNGAPLSPLTSRPLSQSLISFNPLLARDAQEERAVEAVWKAMWHLTKASGRYHRKLCNLALELAWVASGRIDATVSSWTNPWDCAAGTLLIEEVGGVVTDLYGQPWTPSRRGFVAGSTAVQLECCKALDTLLSP